jgi:type III restriction enzyme
LVITPNDNVSFGFKAFQLEGLESWNYQPVSQELLLQQLRTEKQTLIRGDASGEREERLENYLVKRLMDVDEINYQENATLLYDLAGQVLGRLRTYLNSDEDIRNVFVSRGKEMAQAILIQMKQHMWRTDTNYRVTLSAPFTILRPQAFDLSGTDEVRDFRIAPPKLSEIKRYVFSGFKRGCYWQAKFDSDTERQMAVLLERDVAVQLWMKPGPGQFRIYDADGHAYQPDFVSETATEKLIIETKRKSEMDDIEVRRKARAAVLWCMIATKHAEAQGEKPWRYLLVPEDAVQPNATLDGLARSFTQRPDMELATRYEMMPGK